MLFFNILCEIMRIYQHENVVVTFRKVQIEYFVIT